MIRSLRRTKASIPGMVVVVPTTYCKEDANKEQVALDIAARDGVREGLICILRTVEPCRTYKLHKNRESKTLDWELFQGKCLPLYPYGYDAYFGFMGARLQTWFPFAIQMWRNGREWLAQRMDQEHVA